MFRQYPVPTGLYMCAICIGTLDSFSSITPKAQFKAVALYWRSAKLDFVTLEIFMLSQLNNLQ